MAKSLHEYLREFHKKVKVVAWPRVEGIKVTTCGYDEEALGLTEYIAGWGPKGYYVRYDRTPEDTRKFMSSINWLRVIRIKTNFDIRAGRGMAIIRDAECWFVTVERYQRLIKHCSKNFSEEVFEKEVRKAIDVCKRNGQVPSFASGNLGEETH